MGLAEIAKTVIALEKQNRIIAEKQGKEFYSTWNEFNSKLKTDEFVKEFDKVIDELRLEHQMLFSRENLYKFCFRDPQAAMNDEKREFGYDYNYKG